MPSRALGLCAAFYAVSFDAIQVSAALTLVGLASRAGTEDRVEHRTSGPAQEDLPATTEAEMWALAAGHNPRRPE